MTLTEFLLARIAADEAWINGPCGEFLEDCQECAFGQQPDSPYSQARMLTECEAKRRIVELHEGSHECSTYDHNGSVDNCTWVLNGDCSTMRLLALPYATHPDYEEMWGP